MEPLSGLIEFMVWGEGGEGVTRCRYYSMREHRYANGVLAGGFVDGVYTCTAYDGVKLLEASGADGVRVTIHGEDGAPMWSFCTNDRNGPRCEIEAASGKFFGWHANGTLAVVATFSQAIFDAWGVPTRVSAQAAWSPRTHEALRGCVEPWLDAAATRLEEGPLRRLSARGLDALRNSDKVETATLMALVVLHLPLLDYEASLLCQMLMSTDPAVRAGVDAMLDEFGPDTARAAIRLALMRQEDHDASVQEWVRAALLRLGRPALVCLNELVAAEASWRDTMQPTVDWLTDELGPG